MTVLHVGYPKGSRREQNIAHLDNKVCLAAISENPAEIRTPRVRGVDAFDRGTSKSISRLEGPRTISPGNWITSACMAV